MVKSPIHQQHLCSHCSTMLFQYVCTIDAKRLTNKDQVFKTYVYYMAKLSIKPVEHFKNFEIHPYFFCQPACLPTIRPTSGGRILPVFSYSTEYRHANKDLLFRLRFIHCAIVSPFALHCFPFFLTGG